MTPIKDLISGLLGKISTATSGLVIPRQVKLGLAAIGVLIALVLIYKIVA